MRFRDVLGLTFVSGSLLVAQPRQVQACGGCFIPPIPPLTNMSTVVTAHRMAFAFSSTRTVLWDQIQYSGSPADFSWVLPVKGDVTVESGEDAWFEALEAVSNTVASPPHLDCYIHNGSSGCACGSVNDSATAPQSSAGFAGGSGVVVLHEGTVGPYEEVRLRATDAMSLLTWLQLPDHGYTIPADIKPVIEAYQNEGFDFEALRLQPLKDTRQMTPVRVITPGASPTLPLRMVAAGTGDFVGITLYVIAEGRYEAAGFNNNVTVDFSQLTWDWHSNFDTSQGETNYATLRLQALAAGDGRNWLTSFAAHPGFTQTYKDALNADLVFNTNSGMPRGFSTAPGFKNLTDLYFAQASVNASGNASMPDMCSTNSEISSKLEKTAGSAVKLVVDTCPPVDRDAGASTSDAASGSSKVIPCPSAPSDQLAASTLICNNFSDVAAALIGMHPSDVWITRLEANLPHAALAADLKITPAKDQKEVSSAHVAVQSVNPPCDLLSNHPDTQITASNVSPHARMQQAGVGAFTAVGLLVARRASRRRARRKR